MQARLPIDLHARWNGTKARRDAMCSSIVGPLSIVLVRRLSIVGASELARARLSMRESYRSSHSQSARAHILAGT